jgi:hypothetical protein
MELDANAIIARQRTTFVRIAPNLPRKEKEDEHLQWVNQRNKECGRHQPRRNKFSPVTSQRLTQTRIRSNGCFARNACARPPARKISSNCVTLTPIIGVASGHRKMCLTWMMVCLQDLILSQQRNQTRRILMRMRSYLRTPPGVLLCCSKRT